MGKPLMIQEKDDEIIEKLKRKMGAKTKIDVIRTALKLLDKDLSRIERIERWRRAAKAVGQSSLEILREFQTTERFNKLP